jgi:uncharacterized LabA/DUF88 family protein
MKSSILNPISPGEYIPSDGRGESRGLFMWAYELMRRVIAYVDGFNLYHAIDALGKPHLKWVNLWSLAKGICGTNETLVQAYYFTAVATWRPPAAIGRHREYIRALTHAGVTCIVGHFKEKHRKCNQCGATWIAHEEKETDVAIATNLMADAFKDRFDRALVVSADSDLVPAIKCVRKHFPKKAVNVIAPPLRWGHARDLEPILEIAPGRIEKCLLPEAAADKLGNTVFQRPADYAKP